MRNYLFFLSFLMFPTLVLSQAGDNSKNYRDSLRNHILTEGTARISCYLDDSDETPGDFSCFVTYPVGSVRVVENFNDNATEIAKLDRFMNFALTDAQVQVKNIFLLGYSSPDGDIRWNGNLADKRVKSFLDYMNGKYSLFGRYNVRTHASAIDWAGLYRQVAASSYPWRDKVLRIIDGTNSTDLRLKQLMELKGGRAYWTLYKECFPHLRRVDVLVTYNIKTPQKAAPVTVPQETEVTETVEAAPVANETATPVYTAPKVFIPKEHLHPVVAVKTNLFSWAGLTPEFKYRRFTPNLAVEGFFARRWSAVLSGAYADWSYSGGKKWGVSALSLEPRFWLKGDGTFRYAYVGAFGQFGDYNDRHDTTLSSATGDYWQAGLSVGCYVPIVKGLGIEFGVRGGYENRDEDSYRTGDSHNYFQSNQTKTRWGVMGVNVSVSYRF